MDHESTPERTAAAGTPGNRQHSAPGSIDEGGLQGNHHAEDDISSEVVRTINDALERVRAELNSLYARRGLQQGDDALYDVQNPAGEEWEPDDDADWYDYAPAGTMSQREVREGALAGIFDADRRDLIAKQNRLLLLKHIIVTRRIRQLRGNC